MLVFNGDDFGSDDAVYALRNYIWDLREDWKRKARTNGVWSVIFGLGFPAIFLVLNKGNFLLASMFLLVVETRFLTLWASAFWELRNANKNAEILQNEIQKRSLA